MAASDLVIALDRQQNLPNARVCQRSKAHGRLGVNAAGSHLMCCVKDCNYAEPAVLERDTDPGSSFLYQRIEN